MKTYSQGKAYAQKEHLNPSRNWHNLCQMFSRSCVGAGAWAPSARQAANAVPAKHRHTSTPPPPGVLVYYGSPYSGYGHATFAVENGYVWSNDIIRDGKIDKVKWSLPVAKWGLQFRFWTDWTPDGMTGRPVAPKPKTPSRHLRHLLHLAHLVALRKAPNSVLTRHQWHQVKVWIKEKREIP